MKNHTPKLIVFSTDSSWLREFEQCADEVPYVSSAVGDGPHVTAEENLDAIWLTTMQATYFGAQPPFPKGDGRVFEMPAERRAKGLPDFFVAGDVRPEDAPSTLESVSEDSLKIMLKAVLTFNESSPRTIDKIGSIPENFGLQSFPPSQALAIIRKAYANLSSTML